MSASPSTPETKATPFKITSRVVRLLIRQSRSMRDDQSSTQVYSNPAFVGDEEPSSRPPSSLTQNELDTNRDVNNNRINIKVPKSPCRQDDSSSDSDDENESDQDDKKDQKLSQSILWVFCVSLTIAIPLAMTTVGLLFSHSCPSFPSLPILLIVLGGVMTMGNLSNLMCGLLSPKDSSLDPHAEVKQMLASTGNLVINGLSLILILITTGWIYFNPKPILHSVVKDNTNDSFISTSSFPPPAYCHPVLYLFALYTINLMMSFLTCVAVIHLFAYFLIPAVMRLLYSHKSRKTATTSQLSDEEDIRRRESEVPS